MVRINSGMGIVDIMDMPTTTEGMPDGSIHESVLRSYQVLEKVKHWLAAGVPQSVILELAMELQVAYAARSDGGMVFSSGCCKTEE